MRLIAMQSRATKAHERSGYSQNKLETLALVFGLERMSVYLLGRLFTVFTDHRALVYLFSKSKTNRTLAGWMDIIADYNFFVAHLPGVRNVLNDILSRIWPKDVRGGAESNSNSSVRNKTTTATPAFVIDRLSTEEHLQSEERYDLRSLDRIVWTKRYLGPRSMPDFGKNNSRARTPEELLKALQCIFGEMHDPCPTEYKMNGLESKWKAVNYVHPPYRGEAIENWISKAMQQAMLHDALSVLLLPEWKRKPWFIMLAKHAQMFFFKENIRFEPYCSPAAYRSILVVIDRKATIKVQSALPARISKLKLRERVTRQVVEDEAEQERLIREYHDRGHGGTKAILDGLTADGFRWTNMIWDIRRIIQECEACHKFIIQKEGFHPMTSISADMPLDQVAIDLFDMPVSQEGYIKGLIVVDVCTRFVWIRPLRTALAVDVARQLYKLFCQVGFPKIIQSDNGPEFRAGTAKELAQLVQADQRFSTPYHPQGNGMAEAFVKKAKRALLKEAQGATLAWKQSLPKIQMSLNLKVLAAHGSTPFSLFYARRANPLTKYNDLTGEYTPLSHAQLLERLSYMEQLVFPAVAESSRASRSRLEQKYNVSHTMTSFPTGGFVMIRKEQRGSKADAPLKGPFMIVHRTRGGTYVLMSEDKKVLPRNYSPNQLLLVQLPLGLPDSYEIDQIVSHYFDPKTKKFSFLTRWVGYSSEHDTWEPPSSFNDPSFIRKYLEQQHLLGQPGLVSEKPGLTH